MSGGPEMPRRFGLVRNRIYYYWDDVRENMRASFWSPRGWLALGAAASWAVLIVALTYLFLPDPVLPGVGRSTVQVLVGFGGSMVIANMILRPPR
jgi:hypothetical protein